jgi:hypothetical protein
MRRQPQGSFIRKNANVFNGGGRLYCELHDTVETRQFHMPIWHEFASMPAFR